MNHKERGMIYRALGMWVAWIETGDPMMSARDAKNMGEEGQIKHLSHEQMEWIVKIEKLADKILKEHLDG